MAKIEIEEEVKKPVSEAEKEPVKETKKDDAHSAGAKKEASGGRSSQDAKAEGGHGENSEAAEPEDKTAGSFEVSQEELEKGPAGSDREDERSSDSLSDGKKGLFKKKEKKDKKDAQIEELTDRVRRQMAEFDNFRKRTEKEKSAMYEIGARSVIEKMLPVVDSFERGLAGAEDKADDPFVEGMQKIYKQLMTTLEEMDVKPIEAVGKEFDPDLHNAVMHVEDENAGENEIVEELQKGYTHRDSVVRYSMVKVAN